MKRRRRIAPPNMYESFSDIALLMLTAFVFLLMTILMTAKDAEQYQVPKLKDEVKRLQQQLGASQQENQRLNANMDEVVGMTPESQMEHALAAAGLSGKNRKDFDLFVMGLRELPGDSIHIVVDATGSMHGVSNFLIPVLRVIAIRSGKQLNAVTWFSDRQAETLHGTMGAMFDQLMQGAPFVGANETIGYAFRYAAEHAPAPGAYLLIGDEASTDTIGYLSIPSPVFTLPIGRQDPEADWEYRTLAEKTHGKMLHLELH